jgi:hypothetical protein
MGGLTAGLTGDQAAPAISAGATAADLTVLAAILLRHRVRPTPAPVPVPRGKPSSAG